MTDPNRPYPVDPSDDPVPGGPSDPQVDDDDEEDEEPGPEDGDGA